MLNLIEKKTEQIYISYNIFPVFIGSLGLIHPRCKTPNFFHQDIVLLNETYITAQQGGGPFLVIHGFITIMNVH